MKRREIIQTSIRLFAEKGYHQTSVQDIVDACDMSKGAFYGYFASKEALHIAIFKFCFQEMRHLVAAVNDELLSPREKLRRQLAAPLQYICGQKEFFVMYLREQSFSINKELREFMEEFQKETMIWYEESLLALYGGAMRPYFGDLMLTAEGLRNSYLSAMLFLDSKIDIERLPDFLMNRLDDLAKSFSSGEHPIVLGNVFNRNEEVRPVPREEAISLLETMLEELELQQMDDDGMKHVVELLLEELVKEVFDPYFVQGMLANLKRVSEFDARRERIAVLLGVELL